MTDSKLVLLAKSLSILIRAREESLSSDIVERRYVCVSFINRLNDLSLVAEDIAIVPNILYKIVNVERTHCLNAIS